MQMYNNDKLNIYIVLLKITYYYILNSIIFDKLIDKSRK